MSAGNFRLELEVDGEPAWYHESLYLEANPDLKAQVQEGGLRCGLDQFLEEGYQEVLSGKRRLFTEQMSRMDVTLRKLNYGKVFEWNGKEPSSAWIYHYVFTGWREIIDELAPLTFTVSGIEYEYVEEHYLRANLDAAEEVGSGRFRCGLDHFLVKGYEDLVAGKRSLHPPQALPRVIERHPGVAPVAGDHLCVFAHSDPDDLVDETTFVQLRALREIGCDVVFVTPCDVSRQLEALKHECIEIIVRNTSGGDYASWYIGLGECEEKLERYDQLLWVNNGIYFPVRDPSDLLPAMKLSQFDFWGITDGYKPFHPNWPMHYHPHPSFLGISQDARSRGLLAEFRKLYESKPVRGAAGEQADLVLGLPKLARDIGLRVGAYCPVFDVIGVTYAWPIMHSDAETPLDHWTTLLAYYNCPALDARLLQGDENFNWPDAYALISPKYDLAAAQKHSKRVKAPNSQAWPPMVRYRPDSPFMKVLAAVKEPDGPTVKWEMMAEVLALTETERAALYHLVDGRAYWQDLLSKRDQTIRLLKQVDRGELAKKGRLCFFAHHDDSNRFADYIFAFIRGLETRGFETIMITTTTDEAEIERLPRSVKRVLIKNNVGRDFGQWWIALENLEPELHHYDEYLLTNDSFYFPIVDPKPVFDKMDPGNYDLWGMNDSDGETWHLCSYFWVFKRDLFINEFMPRFRKEMVPSYGRWDLIRCFETRYSGLYRSMGYKVGTYVDNKEVVEFVRENMPQDPRLERCGVPVNVYHMFWDVIIKDFNCPIIKVEVLRDNTTHQEGLTELKGFLNYWTTYDYAMIEDHLGDINKRAWSERGKKVR